MKKKPLILGLYIVAIYSNIVHAEDCEPMKRMRKTGSTARRYQPKTTQCDQCHPHHKNIFLFGLPSHEEKLKRCSQFEQIEGLKSVKESLNETNSDTIVLIIPYSDWIPEPLVLDIIAERLGNVSLFTTASSRSGLFFKRCNNLGRKCFILENLLPVISQIENFNTHLKNGEDGNATALLDLYDARWKDNTSYTSTVRHKVPNLHRQIEQLVAELCKRDQILNKIVQIINSPLEVAKAKRIVEDEMFNPQETSLSINDILPLNPKAYDKNRPPKAAGQPTIVYFHVTVLSIDSINEESMTYVADIFLAQSWRDSRLRLPENMSEEYRILDVEWLRNIWRPDCFFKNAKKVTFHEMSIPNHYLWLYHDKTLLYMAKLTLVLSCAMKFESFPHDTQICSMMIESLSHTTHDLVFIWNITDPLVVNPEIELPQLDISNNFTTDCTLTYSTGNFTCLAVVFTLRRRLGYHLFHTYIPSALIVVMSWISFWIKPEAIPARVTLGVTSLLTLGEASSATQNTQSQQNLPPVSYVKAIDVWMSSCSVFVFLSLMEFAVVNNYMGPVATKAMKGFSDEDLRSAIDDYRDLGVRSKSQGRASVHTVPQYDTCYGKSTAILIDQFSRFFFPFSFFILNVVYWSTFL